MRTLPRVLFAATAALALASQARTAHAGLEVYHLYVIWLRGEGEADQKNLDAFVSCLLDHSTYEDYWSGQAQIVEEGSYVVPPPTGALGDAANIGPFIDSLIAAGDVPPPPSFGVPVYEVMVDPAVTSCALGGGTGGRNAPGTVGGNPAGFILTTTNPSTFWPARTPLGGETTLTEHEVAEVIDGLRGGDRCAGDCCCEGWCNDAPSCGAFSGLECPGAPATTFTGASACGSVKGWLVQTLSHQGASTCNCPIACDFTTKAACANDGEVLHAACAKDADCCSGLSCQKWSFTGKAPFAASCCGAVGSSCASGTDCCGGLGCTAGKCVCVGKGQWCINDGDCCAGLACDASSTTCVTAPPPPPPPLPEAGAPDATAAGGEPPDASFAPGSAGGAAGDTPDAASTGPSSCSCGVPDAKRPGASALALFLVALAAARRTRRIQRQPAPETG